MDEFGDGIDVNDESKEDVWRRVLDPKTPSILVLNILEVEYLVISQHPVLMDPRTGEIVDGLFKEVQSLDIVMRNTQRIVENFKEFASNMANVCSWN